ncbi:CDP-alcohol phosphatidyltransferase family protein [Tateyamaria sp.]|nr:CDP-alcohol phosphatidyltransferase family protein [Tateyamaria sp.]
MTIENAAAPNPPILSYIKDLPNICSLAGLGCSLLAIYFLIIGLYPAAMIGMIWAVGFDWADGLIARKMKGRTGDDRAFGSYGVTPAILILSYADFSAVFLPVVFVTLVFGAIRLSYFSTFGLSGDAKYTGLAIDNNSIILVFVVMFAGYFERPTFAIILAVCGLCLAGLNVSQIKTPKLSGNPVNVVILAIYTLCMTLFYGWSMLQT